MTKASTSIMAPGCISAAALLVLAQHLPVDAFSVNGFAGASVRSQARASVSAPSMVATAPTGKPMTKEMQRKMERLEQERIRKYVTPPEQYENQPLSTATHEHLIGEEMVKDDASASALADKCIAEAERLFSSDEGWTKVLEEDGIFVETKDVAGPYFKSGVRVVRGLGAINCDADEFYNFQVRLSKQRRGKDSACGLMNAFMCFSWEWWVACRQGCLGERRRPRNKICRGVPHSVGFSGMFYPAAIRR